MSFLFSLFSKLAFWLGFARDNGPKVVHEVVSDIDAVDHAAHKVEDAVDKAVGNADGA